MNDEQIEQAEMYRWMRAQALCEDGYTTDLVISIMEQHDPQNEEEFDAGIREAMKKVPL